MHKRRVDNGFRQIRFHPSAGAILLRDLGFLAWPRSERTSIDAERLN
jgi:hypothetical protein